jgi:hypothetical protein
MITPSANSRGWAEKSSSVRFSTSVFSRRTHLHPSRTGSDPRAGTPSSQLNSTAILTLISLYYLTDSFLSSVWIYVANPESLSSVYTNKASSIDAPMLFSQYKYNVAYWPEEFVAKVGNFVSYTGALRSS